MSGNCPSLPSFIRLPQFKALTAARPYNTRDNRRK